MADLDLSWLDNEPEHDPVPQRGLARWLAEWYTDDSGPGFDPSDWTSIDALLAHVATQHRLVVVRDDDDARGPEAHPERDPDVLQLEIDACRAEIVRLRGQVAAHEAQQEAWLDAEGALRGEIDLLREIVRSFDDCSLTVSGTMDDHEWEVTDLDGSTPVTQARPDLAECLRRCGVNP